jgi:hypothetical protein
MKIARSRWSTRKAHLVEIRLVFLFDRRPHWCFDFLRVAQESVSHKNQFSDAITK